MSEICYTADVEGASVKRSEILVMWNDGMMVEDIKRAAKVSGSTIRRIVASAISAGFVSTRPSLKKFPMSPRPSDEREAVAKLYGEGRSYREIAEELGITRSAVAGLVKRMGLSSPQERPKRVVSEARTYRRAEPNKPAKPPAPEPRQTVRAVTSEDLAQAKTLADLGADECRFPLNDPAPGLGETTLFCAKETSGTYCRRHTKLTSSPAPRDITRLVRRFL